MTLRRGLLFSCTAATLLAQEFPSIHLKVDTAFEQAIEAQRDLLAQTDLLADAKFLAKEAMALRMDAFALQAQFGGKKANSPLSDEEDMKLMAIDSIMQSDPERAIPVVEKVLQNQQASMRLRSRALQSIARSRSPKAQEIVARIAKDGANPELQSRAIQLLGSRENPPDIQLLTQIYTASSNADVKRQVLRSWANSGAKEQVLNVARSEPNLELREFAIRHLGQLRANAELGSLYAAETSVEIRERLLRGLAESEDWQKLLDIAKTEKNEELRSRAIQQAASMKAAGVSEALVALYNSSSDSATRGAILRGLSQQRSAKQLIAVARKETNPELKRAALQHLTRMKGDEVTTYLTELLEK